MNTYLVKALSVLCLLLALIALFSTTSFARLQQTHLTDSKLALNDLRADIIKTEQADHANSSRTTSIAVDKRKLSQTIYGAQIAIEANDRLQLIQQIQTGLIVILSLLLFKSSFARHTVNPSEV